MINEEDPTRKAVVGRTKSCTANPTVQIIEVEPAILKEGFRSK